MKPKFLILLLAIATASIAVTFFLRWRARVAQSELQARLEYTTRAIASAGKTYDQLTDQPIPPSEERRRQLFRLRAQVNQLRRDSVDPEFLNAGLAALKQEISDAARRPPKSPPAPPDRSSVRAHWAKEDLDFAGFTNSFSALQSSLFAMTRGDRDAILSALSPTCASLLSAVPKPDWTEEDIARTSADAIAQRGANFAMLNESLKTAVAFDVLNQPGGSNSADPATTFLMYKVYVQPEGRIRAFGFRKLDDEWRLEGVYTVDDPHGPVLEQNRLWPSPGRLLDWSYPAEFPAAFAEISPNK